MRVPLALLLVSLLAGCTQVTIHADVADPGIRYDFAAPVTPAAPEGFGSEPSLLAAPDGTLYFTSVMGSAPPVDQPNNFTAKRGDGLWRSTDQGRNWTWLGKADYPFGGGDSDIDVLASGRLLLTGQWRPSRVPDNPANLYPYVTGGESVAYSDDQGATWTPRPTAGYLPWADRNWLATDGDAAYLVFNAAPGSVPLCDVPAPIPCPLLPQGGVGGLMVGKSLDGGLTWLPPVLVPGTTNQAQNDTGPNGIAGDAVVDSKGTLFIPYGTAIGGTAAQRVYRSRDGGRTFDELVAHEAPAGEKAGAIFGTLALDKADGLHYVWAETHAKGMRIFHTQSRDGGDSWSPAVQVTPDTVTAAFPWVVAGEAGHVAIGYYATYGSGLPDDAPANATWVPIVSFANVTATGTMSVTSVPVTQTPNHVGPICTQGTGCSGGRELGDFFEMAVLPSGKVAVAFADDTGPAVVNRVAVQSEGPGLCPSMPGLRLLKADEDCT
ncbi:MAG: sialidase family protein [Thermoplasmatota archaeon]